MRAHMVSCTDSCPYSGAAGHFSRIISKLFCTSLRKDRPPVHIFRLREILQGFQLILVFRFILNVPGKN